jgi:hypothetical protein
MFPLDLPDVPGALENLIYCKHQYRDIIQQGLHERLHMHGGNRSVSSSRGFLRRILLCRGSRWALVAVLAIAPGTVGAQESSSTSATKIPEIHVIATTPVAPPARPAPARPAPAARPSGRAVAAPAAATPAPTEATTAKPMPGVVDQDKIPLQRPDSRRFRFRVLEDSRPSAIDGPSAARRLAGQPDWQRVSA